MKKRRHVRRVYRAMVAEVVAAKLKNADEAFVDKKYLKYFDSQSNPSEKPERLCRRVEEILGLNFHSIQVSCKYEPAGIRKKMCLTEMRVQFFNPSPTQDTPPPNS